MARLFVLLAMAAVCAASREEMAVRDYLLSVPRDLLVRPAQTLGGTVHVKAGLSVNDVEINGNTATLSGWLQLEWNNTRLSWEDQEALANVEKTRMVMSEMWSPDIMPYNMLPSNNAQWLMATPALVYRDGRVLVVPTVSFTVRCGHTISDAGERLSCLIKMGSWTHAENELDLTSTNSTVAIEDYSPLAPWVVESSEVVRSSKTYDCCCCEKYVALYITVVFKPRGC